MPSLQRRSYQGDADFIETQVKVRLTLHVRGHCMLEEGWEKIKLNKPGRQKSEKGNIAVAKRNTQSYTLDV